MAAGDIFLLNYLINYNELRRNFMILDKDLIQSIRILKAKGMINNYYEVAKVINISEKSLYNWMSGRFTIKYSKKILLYNYI